MIIAVLDTGVTLRHSNLASVLWTNLGEVAGNGADDDGNGYIDDVNGWDFRDIFNDNDPSDTHGHETLAVSVGAVNGSI